MTATADWERRVVERSQGNDERSVDRGRSLIQAAAVVLDRSDGDDITVQEVADEAGQSLRTLYQYFASKDDLLLAVFEEAMRTYAVLVRRAIDDLTDPLERLVGAMVAAVRMPEQSGTGLDRGLVRLRLKLAEVEPESVARAQVAMAELYGELVREAMSAGRIDVADADSTTFLLLSMNATFVASETLGNDSGVRRPDVEGIATFCLQAVGGGLADGWFEAISDRLHLPTGPVVRGGGRGGAAAPS